MAVKTIKVQDTNIVEIKDNITSIESVGVKTSATNKFYSETSIYEIFGNNVVLRRPYAEIKVTYNYQTGLDQETRLSKSELNKELEQIANSQDVKDLEAAANKFKEQLTAGEGVNFTELDKKLAGFQSLAAPVLENIKTTFEKIPVIITDTAVNAKASQTQKSDIDSITGTSTSDGKPNVIVVAGNAKGVNSVYQGPDKQINATPTQIKGVVKGVSPVNVAIDEDNILEVVSALMGSQLLTSQKKFVKAANKAEEQIAPETSYANIMAGFMEGATGSSFIQGFGKARKGVHQTLPALIEGEINQYTTNINKNSIRTGIVGVSINQSSIVENLGGGITTFGGKDHIFQVVDTEEELKKELSNIKRDITSTVVHWSHTWADQFLNAADIDRIHRAQQKKKLGAALYAQKDTFQEAGIMWHYCILKDGTLQRGRPIELNVVNEMPHAERAIHIGFVAGYNVNFSSQKEKSVQPTSKSITQKQWQTFDLIVKTLLETKPGISILGHGDIHNSSSCPGFDVEAYVTDKYPSYVSLYTDKELESADALTSEEMVNKVPTVIANPAPSIEKSFIDFESLALANTDTSITDEDINQALTGIRPAENKINRLNIQFSTKEQDAVLKNDYYDERRTLANDALYNLRDDRKPSEEQAAEYRKILINAGYEYNEGNNTWLKK